MNMFTVSRNFRDEVQPSKDGAVRAELFFPVKKYDERTGDFEAWSTVEELDNHNEICDVEKSWPALVAWGEQQKELSRGLSVGNLRIQHRRDTIGGQITMMERRDLDGKPAVYVAGRISDEKAKSDAAEGRITGLSIRGVTKQWADPDIPGATRLAFTQVEEKSLCDRPAVPHALIEVLKSDGGTEMVEATGRSIAQFWDCGVEGCIERHALKGEAVKCEGVLSPNRAVAIPRRVEVNAEVQKSLWNASNAIAVLTSLMYLVDDTEYEETWEAINQGNTDGLPIVAQLKDIARRMCDALTAMIADEKRELGEELNADTAMSFAMRALAKNETAKQLIKSLRVPSGDGGNGGKTATEEAMQDTEIKAAIATGIAEALKQYDADRKALAEAEAAKGESEKAATAAIDSRINVKLQPLVKALGGDEASTDVVGEVAKAYTAQVATSKTNGESIAEVEKAIDGLTRTVALVAGVSVKDDAPIAEVLKAVSAKPAAPVAQIRSVSKADDTADTSKSTDSKRDPFADLERIA